MSSKLYYIYKITNKINGRCYIGFSGNIKARFNAHKSAAKNKQNNPISRALAKYGINNFDFEIIYQSTDKDHTLLEMEPKFIKEFDSRKSGYNQTDGGDLYPYANKTWMLLSPEGKIIETNKLTHFCEENGLKADRISVAVHGRSKHHYGWICRDIHKKTEEEKAAIKDELLDSLVRKYLIVHPDCNYTISYSLNKFAEENNLSNSALMKGASYKGFRAYIMPCARHFGAFIKEKAVPFDGSRSINRYLISYDLGAYEYVDNLFEYAKTAKVSYSTLRTSAAQNKPHSNYSVINVTDKSQEEISSMLKLLN